MSSTENNEVAVEKVDAAEEKTAETKEVKGAKRPAEVRRPRYLLTFFFALIKILI